jgi:SPP1 gp7 family putative phage head morphogenesis protein
LATGQATTGTGTYSQAQTHADVKQEFVEGDARALMEVVNGQLVRPLVELNFGAGLPLPIWTIDYESKDLQAELELDSWLVGLGLELPRWYFYEKYKRPMPASDDEVVSGGSGVGWGGGWGPNAAGVGMGARMRGRDGHNGHNGHRGRDGRNCGEGVRRVKFAVAAGAMTEARRRRREMDGVFARIVTMGAGAVRALLSGVKGEAAAAGSLAELALRIERMKAERAGVDALTEAFATAKTGALCLGAAHVMRWVGGAGASAKLEDEGVQVHVHVHEKRGDERTRSVKGGRERMRAGVIADWEPVTPEQAIRWFLDLVPLTESDLEQLAAEARARSFTVADVESRELLTRIQERIGDFLREGRTLAEWQSEWAAMTSEWGLEGKSPWQVETMFRTETMRAYGAGRQLALNDPDIKEGFPAYQYIAILDDRTRETHAALHGFVADREDPVWDRITPPWDYNCRCDLIPLSVGSMKELGVYDAWAAATLPQTVRLGDGSERNPREFRGSDGFRGLGL